MHALSSHAFMGDSSTFFYLFNNAAQWWVSSFAKVFSWMFTKVYPAIKRPKKQWKITTSAPGEFNSLCLKLSGDTFWKYSLTANCLLAAKNLCQGCQRLHDINLPSTTSPRFFPTAGLFSPHPTDNRHAHSSSKETACRSHYHLVPGSTLSFSLTQISCKTGLNPRCYK